MANQGAAPSGITTRVYKSGSIIYFEGDKSEFIYVLKTGRVFLTSTKLDTGEEVKEDVRQGEFFGVKSSLGKYPREETAQTIGETTVLSFTLADFERLILRNVNVVRKMLRVFSNQLRRIGKTVRSVLGEGEDIDPAIELFRIGEYYYKAGVFQQAQYAFKKYMEYYPDSQYAAAAMERIKAIGSGNTDVSDGGMDSSQDSVAVSDDQGGDDFSFDDNSSSSDDSDSMFDFDDSSSDSSDSLDSFGDTDSFSGETTALGNEMDDFLSDFDDSEMLGEDSVGDGKSLFDKASGMFESGDYSGAIENYEKLIMDNGFKESNLDLFQKSHVEVGRCHLKLREQKEALTTFTTVIKEYPGSGSAKEAFFYVGTIFESVNKNDKALAYYKKVAGLPPEDSFSQMAKKKISQLNNG